MNPPIWVHCASVGEYEQAKPILQHFKQKGFTTLVSFFSLSGFEWKTDPELIDQKILLPFDRLSYIQKLISSFQPKILILIRSEFWPNLLKVSKDFPVVVVNSKIDTKSLFLRGVYQWHLKNTINHFFVLDQASYDILGQRDFEQRSLSGHTRLEAVQNTKQALKPIDFKYSKTIILGSVWPVDLEVLWPVFTLEYNIIVVPHVIDQEQIDKWSRSIDEGSYLYSKLPPSTVQTLWVDAYGLLKDFYHLADFAYVGGGFGKALHSVFEVLPAGIPVFFGPKNLTNFADGQLLVDQGIGFAISDFHSFKEQLERLESQDLDFVKTKSNEILQRGLGSSQKIVDFCIQKWTL